MAGETLARDRKADPEAVEEVTWRKLSNAMLGVPVWSHAGIIRTGETYKDKVKRVGPMREAQSAALAGDRREASYAFGEPAYPPSNVIFGPTTVISGLQVKRGDDG